MTDEEFNAYAKQQRNIAAICLLIIFVLLATKSYGAAKKFRGGQSYSYSSSQPIPGYQKMPGYGWAAIRHALFGNCRLLQMGRCPMCAGIQVWYNDSRHPERRGQGGSSRLTYAQRSVSPPLSVPAAATVNSISRASSNGKTQSGQQTGNGSTRSTDAERDVGSNPAARLDPVKSAGQALSSVATVDAIGKRWGLTPSDVVYDAGCGPANVLIQLGTQYGCRGIGVEIDPEVAAKARKAVNEAVAANKLRAGQIEIITGDMLEVTLLEQPTHIFAFLWPDLLEQMFQAGKLEADHVALPGHPVEGMRLVEESGIYYYDKGTTAMRWVSIETTGQQSGHDETLSETSASAARGFT